MKGKYGRSAVLQQKLWCSLMGVGEKGCGRDPTRIEWGEVVTRGSRDRPRCDRSCCSCRSCCCEREVEKTGRWEKGNAPCEPVVQGCGYFVHWGRASEGSKRKVSIQFQLVLFQLFLPSPFGSTILEPNLREDNALLLKWLLRDPF